MSAVDDVRGQRHIYGSVLYFFKPCGNYSQIFRIVDLGAEPVLNVQSCDIACSVQFIQGVLGIDFAVTVLAEFDYLIKPDLPVVFFKLIEDK